MAAVSYTHLDVYKRQVEDNADMAYKQIFDEPSENETKPYDEEWGGVLIREKRQQRLL